MLEMKEEWCSRICRLFGTGDRIPWREVVRPHEDHEGSGIAWFFSFVNRKKDRRQENLLDTVHTSCDEGLVLREWEWTWVHGKGFKDGGVCISLEVELEGPFDGIGSGWEGEKSSMTPFKLGSSYSVLSFCLECLLCFRWVMIDLQWDLTWKNRIVSCSLVISKAMFIIWLLNN